MKARGPEKDVKLLNRLLHENRYFGKVRSFPVAAVAGAAASSVVNRQQMFSARNSEKFGLWQKIRPHTLFNQSS
jgi:hypothetical protein